MQCEICKNKFEKRDLKKIGRNWRCKDCYKKRLLDNRKKIKRLIKSEIKQEPLIKFPKSNNLIIKGSKEKHISNKLHNYLTMEEKQFLYRKYTKLGLSHEEIRDRIKKDTNYLRDYLKKLKEKNLECEELNMKFKEKFAELISRDNY